MYTDENGKSFKQMTLFSEGEKSLANSPAWA
jgi:hypothetical protein